MAVVARAVAEEAAVDALIREEAGGSKAPERKMYYKGYIAINGERKRDDKLGFAEKT